MKQKKVGNSENELQKNKWHSNQAIYTDCINEYDDNENSEYFQTSIPRLPSVKDLAALFQPKQSPEPKPRKSSVKVMTSFFVCENFQLVASSSLINRHKWGLV